MPFGHDCEYETFAACVVANQDKDDPDAFCAALMEETETMCKTREYQRSEIERRIVARPVEFRQTNGNDNGGTLDGYAAVVGQEVVIGSFFPFREVIEPGAFKEAIDRDDVRALFNHDPNFVLGRNTNGTLTLSEDDIGLKYSIDLNPDDPDAARVRAKVKRGDITQSSFAFTVPEDGDEWEDSEVKAGKLPLRRIKTVELYDVSPVTYPAYPQTSVSARAEARAKQCTQVVPSTDATQHETTAEARSQAEALAVAGVVMTDIRRRRLAILESEC